VKRAAGRTAPLPLRTASLLKPWACAAVALAAALTGAPGRAAPASQVFLVQNSGWMEPFFSDPASPYKALVSEVIMAATREGDAMVLASFNQGLPGAPSPRALLAARVDPTTQRERIGAALAPLDTARKPGSAALADTDLNEALASAIGQALQRKPGLVWLFTNNRNSPNNDQATARRNREFYQLIHSGGAIAKTLAFPLKMPVKGKLYSAGGLMVYVFAIGAGGARQLDEIMASGRLQKVLTEPPARLKPLDRETVRLVPGKVEDAQGVRFSMRPGGVLVAEVSAGSTAPAAHISWQLENRMYPYTIVNARLSARSVLGGEERAIVLHKPAAAPGQGSADTQVRGLAPGNSMPLQSSMTLPVAKLPGKWSFEAIGAAGSAYVLPGRIEVRLSEQQLALSPAFRQRMAALFPGDPLPDIFTPPAQVQGSLAVLPVEVRVNFGLGPLLALLGALLTLLLAGGALLLAFTRPRKVVLTVDGETRTLSTRVGGQYPVHDRAGNIVAQLKTTLSGHKLVQVREGAQVRLGR
jgi:hypothetical protein